jgi:hypothetical protein
MNTGLRNKGLACVLGFWARPRGPPVNDDRVFPHPAGATEGAIRSKRARFRAPPTFENPRAAFETDKIRRASRATHIVAVESERVVCAGTVVRDMIIVASYDSGRAGRRRNRFSPRFFWRARAANRDERGLIPPLDGR